MYMFLDGGEFIFVITIKLIVAISPTLADVGLWFVKSPEPFVAPLNDEVVFECSLNVVSELIRWRHGRRFLQQNHTTSSRTSSANNLNIKVTDESRLGDYQCVAWFGATALASVPAKLTLAEIKPFPSHQAEKSYQVTAGNTVAIQCPPPVSNPSALIQYYLNDKKLLQSAQILPTSNSLLLHNVTSYDSGIYTCSATNYITGQTFNAPIRVHLEVVPSHLSSPHSPRFLSVPQSNYVAQSGSNVTIECVAVGEPPPRVTWYKAGNFQTLPKNRTDLLIGGLHLRNIIPDDTGEYVCEMNNGVSPPLLHKVLLHVQEAPVILKEPNRTLVEEEGDTELACEVSGNPIPIISWTLNGEILHNDSHISIYGSKLILGNAQKKHAGIYQCFASNSVGTTYGTAMLQVSPKQIVALYNSSDLFSDHGDFDFDGHETGRPLSHSHRGKKEHTRRTKQRRKHKETEIVMVPPSRPNVTRLSDRSVMVRWHVPSNNGLPISFFKVQYREVGSNETGKPRTGGSRWMTSNEDIPAHIRSYEIDRLEPNRIYKFRVAAVYSNNDNKLSQNSFKFYLHQGVPAERSHLIPPTLISAESPSPTSLQIQWQYLNSVLTPVDGFYVYYRATSNAGDYIKATVEGEKIRSFVITHLQSDTAYDIKIQSFTVGAASNFSSIITRKTLVDPNATTEYPQGDMKTPNVNILSTPSSNTTQLVIIFGAVVGGFVAIFVLLVLICYIRQRSSNDHSTDGDDTTDKNSENTASIHHLEPVTMNGYGNHNGKMLNGNAKSLQRNGYVAPHAHINITSNPLAADSKHEKNSIEMAYLSHNNNCSIDSCSDEEISRSRDKGLDRSRDRGLDRSRDRGLDIKCAKDCNKWRLREQSSQMNGIPHTSAAFEIYAS